MFVGGHAVHRVMRCTLYMPIPIPITKALGVMSASPGSKATAVRQESPVVAMTGPDALTFPGRPGNGERTGGPVDRNDAM